MPDEEKQPPKRRLRRTVGFGPAMGSATVPPALHDPLQREQWNLPQDPDKPGSYMVELNLFYHEGLQAASDKFRELYAEVLGPEESQKRKPVPVSKSYFRCDISVKEWQELVKRDEAKPSKSERVIYKIWPDFPVKPLIDRSVATVKADAAVRSYAASGEGVAWAVIDSGIDARHIHFGGEKNPTFQTLTHPDVKDLHRDFTGNTTTGASRRRRH